MMRAVYAGSFDPIHAGHIDIIRRAVRSFGGITLLLADNPSKTYLLSKTDRINWVREVLNYAGVNGVVIGTLPADEFLADYCAKNGITHIVKGLRNGTDLESEMTQEWYTKKMNENVETIYFSTNEKFKYLSSSSIKALTKMNRQDFINYMKKIAFIDGMSAERMEDYLWKIHDVYGEF